MGAITWTPDRSPPERETSMDGSDAIADWPILNALLNTSAGATWVSVHHGGGVGIGYSLHAGMVIVADGTREADEKLERVLTTPASVARHADAGYPGAIAAPARGRFPCAPSGLMTPTSPPRRRGGPRGHTVTGSGAARRVRLGALHCSACRPLGRARVSTWTSSARHHARTIPARGRRVAVSRRRQPL
jgi:hypothetical protein